MKKVEKYLFTPTFGKTKDIQMSPVIDKMIPDYLINSTQLYVVGLDVNGQVNFIGKKFEMEFPLFKKEFYIHNFSNFLDKEDHGLFEFLLSDLLETPNKSKQVFLNLSNQKKLNWEFSILKSDEGDIEGVLGIGYEFSNDATGKSEIEEIYKKSGFDLSIIENIYFKLNEQWEITFVNDAAQKFFGKCSNSLLKKTIWHVYPNNKLHQSALQFKKAREENEIIVFEERRVDLERWFKVFIVCQHEEMHVIMKDITKDKMNELAVFEAQMNLKSILEHADESYFLVDLELNILSFNENAKKLVKSHFKKELKEKDDFLPYLLSGLEEQFLKDLETVFSGKSITYEKEVINSRTGKELWFEHKFFPLFNSDKKVIGFVYANKNIEEKKLEFKRVEEKNKVLREVAYIQSHLLRSPLSSMLGLLDLIDKKQLDAENTKYFSYLKPLAQELDMVIRENARKVNEFD
ncbi:PAS domain S-box [Belliella baltica DSM 15883]|uniref:histidine kinase n=1 Tax=Belliella baltica (strain DSM 15883 / CIP 108006 / LMG 21964 / BA134) TaxID=866536 RepID=I3Z8Q8_BELBD|nr:PAS domain-containing protein [Belliella baltica]AFL85626.1 PAS domain S-box [Belliella baltica DSM 15883]